MDQLNQGPEIKGFSFKRLLERKTLAIVALLLIAVGFISPRIFSHKERHKEPLSITEERKFYKESDLNQVLDSSRRVSNSLTTRTQKSPQQKRNYATEIAVFLFKDSEKGILPKNGQSRSTEKIGLSAGAKISGYLSGTLFSYNTAAPVTVVVSKNVEKDGKVLIPEKSQFLGEAGVLKSLNRINVNFHLLILPDGKQVRVHAMALSEDGSSGIKGRVSKHRDMRVLKAIGETALAGVSLFAGGVRSEPYALEDQMRMNLAQNLTGEARQDLRSVKVETSITVDSFTPVQVILLEAI